jgi:predicted RNA-binding Zn ribbon-like protein
VDEASKRQVGEQIEPGGRPKAPGRLQLLQRFVNTHNHEFPPDWDRIGTGEKAQAWLRQKGFAAHVGDDDAARLRELREALRALAIANHGGPPDPEAVATLRAAAAGARLTVTFDDDGRTAFAAGDVVATLLGILHEAQLSGDWPRMKACRQCGYAFYDRSKNRSASWCDMSICGNRAKNRAYYRRRKPG